MHIGTQSTEQPCLLTPSSLQFRTDASVTGHALAPVDSGLLAAQAAIDRKALREYRLQRIRQQLRAHDYGGILPPTRSTSAMPPTPTTLACG